MSVQKILIASVLKPVDDPRGYARIGKALATVNNNEIHIAGFESKTLPTEQNIYFHTLYKRGRLSIFRLSASWKLMLLIFKVKPQKVVVSSTELLLVTIVNKILFGYKIYYDVQENYFKNIWYNQYYPPIIKHLLAITVRAAEMLSYPFLKRYLLAERCYYFEMAFTKHKATVIENKYAPVEFNPITKPGSERWLVFTGTIAKEYGIFEAINLALDLYKLDSHVRLKIIGYCQQKKVLSQLKLLAVQHDFITLIGGDHFVSHTTLLAYIEAADAGLLSYQFNKSTVNRIPTKVYEHLAFNTPMIIQENIQLKNHLKQTPLCLFQNYHKPDLISCLKIIQAPPVVNEQALIDPIWSSEKQLLISLF